MSRTLFGMLGAVMALFPDAVLDAFEAIALESPGEYTPRPWLRSGVRAEGLVYAALAVVGGRAYTGLLYVVGAVGAVVVAAPRQYLAFGARLAYEDGDSVEWTDGFVRAARWLGVCCVLLAVRGVRTERED
ncbi:hypothetical protein [Natronomonas pharaonis]|nr:hypothetical protein [Natronomonas pharaonis]